MRDNCRSCTVKDVNNNRYPVPMDRELAGRDGQSPGSKYRGVQVTAKVLFGSVQAITKLQQDEKSARENKRI